MSIDGDASGFGLYVHIPFCPQHCPYCAFAVLTGHRDLYSRYVDAVCNELHQWREEFPSMQPLQTIFIGGGMPSMLSPAQLRQILETASTLFGIEAGAEITLEANPSTVDAEKFDAIRYLGVNRLSLGVQAFQDDDLKSLGRLHSAREAELAFEAARQADFSILSLDLIFSIPGAPREHWRATLQRALDLRPDHISTYSLTIEEGTRFSQRYHQGRLQTVSEIDDAWAYEWCMKQMELAGFEHYEVSNFARPGCRSRHNWGYWHGAVYFGVGLSAHAFVAGERRWNTPDIHNYLEAVEAGKSPRASQETLEPEAARREQLWLQLRTCDGVCLARDELRALQSMPKFQAMLTEDLIYLCERQLTLTPRGFLLADVIGIDVVDMMEKGATRVNKKVRQAR